MDPGFWIRQL